MALVKLLVSCAMIGAAICANEEAWEEMATSSLDTSSTSSEAGQVWSVNYKSPGDGAEKAVKAVVKAALPHGSNMAAPPGYKAKPGSGKCMCGHLDGSGNGLDSCAPPNNPGLCCAASPNTDPDPAGQNYFGKNKANLCYEEDSRAEKAVKAVVKAALPHGSNMAAPPGYKAKPGSGKCMCGHLDRSGNGLDSCAPPNNPGLCCAASPNTDPDPAGQNYVGKNKANLCYEEDSRTPAPGGYQGNKEDVPDLGAFEVHYTSHWTSGLTCPEGIFTIPDGYTSIGGSVFESCTGLTSVNIPTSVTYIGGNAFRDCTGLTSVKIPPSVTSIGQWAFIGCTGLTSVKIPTSVKFIDQNAFEGCTGLTSVSIPTGGQLWIDSYAFYNTGLTSVKIPYSTKLNARSWMGSPFDSRVKVTGGILICATCAGGNRWDPYNRSLYMPDLHRE